MENIIKPSDFFDSTKLCLTQPSGIQGGAYFTKLEYNSKPLYIQTTKSLTKQGFVKSGKKHYLDLMFDKNSESMINWFENIEETCKKLIYEKKETWFQHSLEEADIENAFNSIIRVYKSGKYYLVRTNVKNSQTTEPIVKIYNENEVALTPEDLQNESEIISILEIQGIKFTSRNFQIEIELKQIMVLDNEPIFNSCLIKTKKTINNDPICNPDTNAKLVEDILITEPLLSENIGEPISEPISEPIGETISETISEPISEPISENAIEQDAIVTNNDADIIAQDSFLNLEIEELKDDTDKKELEELDINNVDLENLENFTLKKPNKVYFDLYKEARQKAKLAKQNAILAYLEAKNIKKTYMLENLNDSDSDSDFEEETKLEDL